MRRKDRRGGEEEAHRGPRGRLARRDSIRQRGTFLPVDVQGLVKQVPKGLEKQIYAVSVMAIDLDRQKEADIWANTLSPGPTPPRCERHAHAVRHSCALQLNGRVPLLRMGELVGPGGR